tara:strand:+ start:336 stop:461 length:126 start_codon:yes stop_codon:yes gene_type:complete
MGLYRKYDYKFGRQSGEEKDRNDVNKAENEEHKIEVFAREK